MDPVATEARGIVADNTMSRNHEKFHYCVTSGEGRVLQSVAIPYLSSVSFAARSSILRHLAPGVLVGQIERQSVSGVTARSSEGTDQRYPMEGKREALHIQIFSSFSKKTSVVYVC